jgi:hypothetical protein
MLTYGWGSAPGAERNQRLTVCHPGDSIQLDAQPFPPTPRLESLGTWCCYGVAATVMNGSQTVPWTTVRMYAVLKGPDGNVQAREPGRY